MFVRFLPDIISADANEFVRNGRERVNYGNKAI